MADALAYDVFLSHSEKDKEFVRPIAERLRANGLRVWLAEWEIKPRTAKALRAKKVEEGLEHSRVLVLCMSANAFGSEWAALEAGTFRFRDSLSTERRFIPLFLDECTLPAGLKLFAQINWTSADREQEYRKLLEACRSAQARPTEAAGATRARFAQKIFSLGHTDSIASVAFSPDGKRALTGSRDNTARIWDVNSGNCIRVLEGHSGSVYGVAWSADGRLALSGSQDSTARIWDVNSGNCIHVLEGHADYISSVAWSADGTLALSGSKDSTARIWDVNSGNCIRVLEGHSGSVWSVAWRADGKLALSGSSDSTARIWDVNSGNCIGVLEGHSRSVRSVAWSADGKLALSASSDHTTRIWDVNSRSCIHVLKLHARYVSSVAWTADGKLALSGSYDNAVRIWDVNSGNCICVLEGHSEAVLSSAWSADAILALSGSVDNTARIWDVNSGNCIRVLEGHSGYVSSVVWSDDLRLAMSGSQDNTARIWDVDSGNCIRVLEGHSGVIHSVAWSADGKLALSGSQDNTARIWDINSGTCIHVLEGHSDGVLSVAWSAKGKFALSGSSDSTARIWDVNSGNCIGVLEGHSDWVRSVAPSADGKLALSGSSDNTARIWVVNSGKCIRVLEGHSGYVSSVVWSADTRLALSGSQDNTARIWVVNSGKCIRVLEGHSGFVNNVAWSADGKLALSGSADNTARIWDVDSGKCIRVLEGHSGPVCSVAWGADVALSGAENGVMRVWDVRDLVCRPPADGSPVTPDATVPEQLQYTNAKVLLVGESGVGKTGLSKRLVSDDWQPSDSTVGAWATQWKLLVAPGGGAEREIWLWDFGGQADQRLIHQLYMDETAMAVLVFDGQKDDLFETLGQWDRDLARASRQAFSKLLVAGRVDAGGLRVSRSQVDAFCKERGFNGFLETSAKSGAGCAEFKQAILDGIRWDEIPCRTTLVLFKRLKDEIVRLKDGGGALIRFNELRESLQLRLSGEVGPFRDQDLKAVLTLLAGPGVVWELKFGSWILLQPERINAYAQAVIQTMRADEQERGCLSEERVLNGDLDYQSALDRLEPDEERFVLLAMHQTLVERGLCFREHTETGPVLIFPSYYRRERPELVSAPAVLVSYRFTGFLDDIYATLVVRLQHTKPFQHSQLWRYAADFNTLTQKQLGVKLTRLAEGAGELDVYFDPTIPIEEKIIFSQYVHDHLLKTAKDVVRLRHYVCPHCGTPVGNPQVAMKKLADGKKDIPCVSCDDPKKRIPLWDELEELFANPEMKSRVRDLRAQSDVVLDNESKERALVGEVISTVALAGQICREFNVSDHGIDMEIEFKDHRGKATGRKLYLQLKSGDSYLRERKSDGGEVFRLPKEHHATYWMAQAFPVLLVIRNAEGEIRWMEIQDYLKRESQDGKRVVSQIVFDGERFDVMSVRKWRDIVLGHDSR